MRIIITGGTGLIGKEVANSFAADHHDVIVLSRNVHKTSGLAPGVRVVGWDGRTANGWGELADGAGAIINLAGESIAGEGFLPSRWSDERKKRILESRMNAGAAVVEAVRAAKVKPGVVVQSSAIGYYGASDTETFVEGSRAGDDFQAEVCKQWETSTAEVERYGVRRVIVRTGVVLSLKGGALTRLMFPFHLFAGGPLGTGKQWFSWIHIEDEVRAIRFLTEQASTSGIYNLTAPGVITNGEFAKIIGETLGRPSFLPAPKFAFQLGFGEVATIVVDGQKVLPKRLEEAGFTWHFPDARSAMRDLWEHRHAEAEHAAH
jgi:uncharacterized protein (TIGR01777 family)